LFRVGEPVGGQHHLIGRQTSSLAHDDAIWQVA
jgi:hypothetical protein